MPESKLLKLKNRSVVPPGGYRFSDPQDDFFIANAPTLEVLVRQATHHRRANGYPIPENFAEVVEDWLCRQIPMDMVTGFEHIDPRNYRPHVLTFTAVQKATREILGAWRADGRRMASASEIEQRSKNCADCKMNSGKAACASCHGITSWVMLWMGKINPPHADRLYVCAIDAVLNLAQVHLTAEAIGRTVKKFMLEKYSESCWKRKIVEEKQDE